eukprot:3191675-Lingulodinium_polyedra.AAC.1
MCIRDRVKSLALGIEEAARVACPAGNIIPLGGLGLRVSRAVEEPRDEAAGWVNELRGRR